MKVLHFIMGKANPDRANGVNHVIHGLAKYTALAGHEVTVVGVSKGMKKPYEFVPRDNFNVHVYNSFFGDCFKALKRHAENADIVHLHSVWQHYNIILANHLIKINKPYVVTVHSGLTSDRLKQSNYQIKMIYHRLFQKKIFNNAQGIHAITKEEISDISKLITNDNIFFVSNGIDLDNFNLDIQRVDREEKNKIIFGYLGRFGVEKNIKSLVLAISKLPQKYLKSIQCHLIGPIDQEGEELINLVKKLNLEHVIIFTGPLYKKDKFNKLSSLDFYVHPAYSDVVSIAVMEAFASGLPCLITRTSQVGYYYNSGAFIMTEPLAQEIKKGLIEMIDKKEEWQYMSVKAFDLVNKVFNWKSSVAALIKEYEFILRR
ncbi:MAG: glycosyltransferase family 4 protein [Bizionia sp.]|nr:glycosyltransferase family 4 protein [Bizionia sp.]